MRVVLVGKPDCHLCDVARQLVEQVCAEEDVGWAELSIVEHPDLAEAYGSSVPVVIVGGRVVDIYRVNPERLRSSIRAHSG